MSREYVEMRVLRWAAPLEMLQARFTTFEFPTHAHAEFTIGEVLEGSELFAHRGRQVEAAAGSYFHINPSEAHNGRAAQGSWTYVAVYPGLDLLRRAVPELFRLGEPRFRAPVSRRPALRGRCARLVSRAFRAPDDLVLQSELVALLRDLMQPGSGAADRERPARHAAAIAAVRARLADEPARAPSLFELAASVALTPLALLRAFRQEVGCTPHTYRTARRIALAKPLLRGGAALSRVALDCGFADQSHFTNTFRAWTGVTPGQYRVLAGRLPQATPQRRGSPSAPDAMYE